MNRPSVLVIGRSGQLAHCFSQLKMADGPIYHCKSRSEVDLTSGSSLDNALAEYRPQLIINTAAWTAVDLAEIAPESAFALNTKGPERLARLCQRLDIPLIHFSTDYVFSGAASRPYSVDDKVAPLNVYGQSKAAGEAAIRGQLIHHLIFRLAWLFSDHGSNFVTTILRLATQKTRLHIVNDQRGSPTYAVDVAFAIHRIATLVCLRAFDVPWGTYHLTNSGETTWYDFAENIMHAAQRLGLPAATVMPISSAQYITKARRPAYSVLDIGLTEQCFGVMMPTWQDAIHRCLASLARS